MNGSDYIKVYDGVLPNPECDKLIGLYSRYPELVEVGRTMGGISKAKKSLDFLMSDLEGTEDEGILESVTQSFDEIKQMYLDDNPYFQDNMGLILDSEYPKMKRYIEGVGNFKTHVDVGPLCHQRQLVIIIYLNDVFNGGGTEFPLQDTVVEARKGRAVCFPPFWTFPHSALKSPDSEKFIVSTFYRE